MSSLTGPIGTKHRSHLHALCGGRRATRDAVMRFTRSTLTNEEKLVLALHYHVRLSATEIGGLLQRSEVHIHRILHDVRSRLRSGMGESLYGSSGEKVGGRRLAGRELRGAFGG